MKRIYSLVFLISAALVGNAQSSAERILNQSIGTIHSLKSVAYQIAFVNKNPFSDGDITKGEKSEMVSFNPDGTVNYKSGHTKINGGQADYQTIYFKEKRYTIDFKDSVFSIDTPKLAMSSELHEVAEKLQSFLKKPLQIHLQKDTVYKAKLCYNFLIKTFDSLINGNRDFTQYQVLIDRKTLLPTFFLHTGAGSATKGGIAIGRIKIYDETHFLVIQPNKDVVPSLPILNGFSAKPTTTLKAGSIAPPLNVRSLTGKPLQTADFKPGVMLLVFGDVGCPANPLANPMLNRLHAKYGTQAFAIANVYTVETETQAKQYIAANGLQFPIYLGSRTMRRAFQSSVTPDFYLIDHEGKIVMTSEGYYNALEADLSKHIDQLLGISN